MNKFIELRKKYKPKRIKHVLLFESPPEHRGYFYDDMGKTTELLFRSLMAALFPEKTFDTKEEGLRYFANKGFYLFNPIYEPVNKLKDKEADEKILDNYTNFKNDLIDDVGKDVPLIIIKKNIWLILREKLSKDGFNVLNMTESIPFPMHYHYKNFESKIRKYIDIY